MKEEKELDKFGKFLIENLYDKGLDSFEKLANGNVNAESKQALQEKLEMFTPNQLEIVKNVVSTVLTTSMHDFLFALAERSDFDGDIEIIVDNKNIAEDSDGLQGELFSEDGWLQKFSQHK